MSESSGALADPDSSFPQACLWYHNSFEAVGRNLLKGCKICIFSSVVLLQLLLISHEAEVRQFCREAPDPLYVLVLTSKEAEDLTLEKPEQIHTRILPLQAPSVFLCNLPVSHKLSHSARKNLEERWK